MKVLCFGDSNTYGFDPRSYLGGRYESASRWVDRLAEKSGWVIFNAGENGREIPRGEGEWHRFERLLAAHSGLDLLMVLLGANDLLQGAEPAVVAERMERFLARVPLERDKIVLIAPPSMKQGAWVPDERILNRVTEVAARYEELGKRLGVTFVDTRGWDIDLTFDGVHFSENGHAIFAENLLRALEK